MSYESTRFAVVLVTVVAVMAVVTGASSAVLAADGGDDTLQRADASSAAAATMVVADVTAAPGETVTVPVVVEGDSIAGYQANLTWDASVLQFESAAGVDLSDPVTNGGEDWVFMTQSQTDGVDSPTVVEVTFTVVGDPGDETALSLVREDSSANDESTQLETALEDGAVVVDGDGSGDDDGAVGEDSVDDGTSEGDDGSGSESDGNADDESVDGASSGDASTGGSDTADDAPSTMLLVLGLVGAGVVLGTGYALGQRGTE